jgi:hypothetical protein
VVGVPSGKCVVITLRWSRRARHRSVAGQPQVITSVGRKVIQPAFWCAATGNNFMGQAPY